MKMLFFLIFVSFLFSCKKEHSNEKYIIFKSDSTNAFGVIDGNLNIYQNIPYKVLNGQTIIFEKSNYAFMFHLIIQVGPDNFYSPNNYQYTFDNQYELTIRDQ